MEKLNIRVLQVFIAAFALAIASTAVAGPYRMSSKQPVVAPPPLKGYFFGYGGWDSGADYTTIGSFDHSSDWMDACPPGYNGHYGYDPSAIPINWDMDSGWTAGGGVGVYSSLFNGSRFEFETSYTSNDFGGDLSYAGFALPANFEIRTVAAMFNYLKEVRFAPNSGVVGYFGGGIGYANSRMDGDIDTILYSDDSSGFAWQLIAGVDFPIAPNLALFTQYRYLVLSELNFTTDFGDFQNTTLDDPSSHAVVFGARVSF